MPKSHRRAAEKPLDISRSPRVRALRAEFAAPPTTSRRNRTDVRIAATLATTIAGDARLAAAIAAGRDQFVLTDVGGTLSVRVRVSIDGVSPSSEAIASLDGAVVDWNSGRIEHAGRRAMLSRTELRLLACLLDGKNEVVPHERLLRAAWPDERPRNAANALAVYVCYLRRRLKEVGLGRAVKTLRRAGYAMTDRMV
ncbi:MAG TPA: winged helix-turn-helix domain-containing protein [Gemmatimonadaceae bacterium]|jgi:DNA-binding response OmpR family regulator